MTPPNDKQETPEETLTGIIHRLEFWEYIPEWNYKLTGKELFDLVESYHTTRKLIEQQAPAKTLPELFNELAYKKGIALSGFNNRDKHWIEAAELYAKQFRRPIEVTDDEIDEEAKMHLSNNKSSCPDDQTEGLVAWSFNKGASWMREKLTGKQ